MPERDPFVDDNWPELRKRMEEGGPPAAAGFVEAFDTPLERRKLYFHAHRAFGGQEWAGKDLEKTADFTERGIEEMLRQSAAEEDADTSRKIKDLANMMSYNLSADLADCWPGDEAPRTAAHFDRGLAAAKRCIAWRTELGKGPGPFSMAWWAKGMHELSLGRHRESVESFHRSLEYAKENASAGGHAAEIGATGHWSVLLGEGYVQIARCLEGRPDARSLLDRCHAALVAGRAARPEEKDDLQFCIDQLREVETRYLG